LAFLSEIYVLRVDLYLHQQGINTTTPGGNPMFQICGVFAEFERAMIDDVAEDLDILCARYNRQDDLVLAAETLVREFERDPDLCGREGIMAGDQARAERRDGDPGERQVEAAARDTVKQREAPRGLALITRPGSLKKQPPPF
jgi:hypothetical protein